MYGYHSFTGVTQLELAEAFAEQNGMPYDSEESLSEVFDEIIVQGVIDQYSEDDQCAIDQAFNDWTDGLCKDGQLHSSQYQEYVYVGKYST